MAIELILGEDCNLNCKYCYYHKQNKSIPREMSFDVARAAIEMFANLESSKSSEVMPVTFFGGEPLLYFPLIKKIVSHYEEFPTSIPLSWHICTNGTLLNEEILTFFDEKKIQIYLSLDGDKGVHDLNRTTLGGIGTFDFILPLLPELVRQNAKIEMVITPGTADRVYESWNFLVQTGFNEIISAIDFNGKWSEESFLQLKREYQKIGSILAQESNNPKKIKFSILSDKINMLLSENTYLKGSCSLGDRGFVIDPLGEIYPCTRFADGTKNNPWSIGNLSIGLNTEKIRTIQKTRFEQKEICRECPIKMKCLGYCCGCISYYTGREIGYVSPEVCAHEQMVLEIADEWIVKFSLEKAMSLPIAT